MNSVRSESTLARTWILSELSGARMDPPLEGDHLSATCELGRAAGSHPTVAAGVHPPVTLEPRATSPRADTWGTSPTERASRGGAGGAEITSLIAARMAQQALEAQRDPHPLVVSAVAINDFEVELPPGWSRNRAGAEATRWLFMLS